MTCRSARWARTGGQVALARMLAGEMCLMPRSSIPLIAAWPLTLRMSPASATMSRHDAVRAEQLARPAGFARFDEPGEIRQPASSDRRDGAGIGRFAQHHRCS